MPRAAIDIGSNSLLLTVVDDTGAILHDEVRIVGLGKGLGDGGEMQGDRLAAAEQVLRDFVIAAKRQGIEPWTIRAVATSAARRATNAEPFFARIHRETGIRVRILTGSEEAELTWIGAQRDLALDRTTLRLVVDLGAGSTELALGDPSTGTATILNRISLELGSMRLTEAFLAKNGVILDRFPASGVEALRAHVDECMATAPLHPTPNVVIGVAGTVTTLAAMGLEVDPYDAGRVHGSLLSRLQLTRFVDAFLDTDAAGRRALASVSPERADTLLAGAVILDRVLAAVGLPHLVVSDRGLRFGLLA
jgi:exopolyphosphatase / guanosine-5'-triphosphate,3'-diphosphate pyrophosphatase